MKQEELRRKLINGTIRVIARDGLDKATTKQIGNETDVNEVYIYRCFNNKEDLFAKAFDSLDDELFNAAMTHVSVMYDHELDFEVRCRKFFLSMWSFLLDNRSHCLAFVRYFYSPYFNKYSAQVHELRFKPLVERFREAFIDEADVWMILNHMLNVILDFAVKVHNGHMPSEDDYSEHVFRVIYASVKQYFR